MKVLSAILIGGLLAGIGDILYAIIHYNIVYQTPPERILQSVAAGLLGQEAARAGGWSTAAIGLAAHLMITIGMAAVFVLASLVLPVLRRLGFVSGPVFGIICMFAMNFVIVPMSRAGVPAQLPAGQFLYGAILAHIVLVGLAIALTARAVLGRGAAKGADQ
jgi:uncharacterized membrane protein YagU involved in acid resistance